MTRRSIDLIGKSGLLLAIAAAAANVVPGSPDIDRQIRFGAEMAEQGNWREAMFRWRRALGIDPDNPRLHNNLAVAHESLGEYDRADAEYRTALANASAPEEIRRNYDLFLKFYDRYKEGAAVPAAEAAPKLESPHAAPH